MFQEMTTATAAQIQEARRMHGERVAACRSLGVDPPNFYTILTEIVNSPPGSLNLPPMTPADRRRGTTFQSYQQYQSPRVKE